MSRDALVVGISAYRYLKPLTAPSQDAEAIAQCLERDGDFQTVRRMPEALALGERKLPKVGEKLEVTQAELEQALEQLFRPNSSQAPDTALFYFSGHGLADAKGYDKGYLATSDTNPNQPRSGLSLRWLQWLLSESPVKQQIIWLDCCHSGGLLVSLDAANPGHENQRDRCFIASSRDYESSWQDLNSPYSVLTKALLEGLDPRRLPGRWIDSFALAHYINQALRGELQKPICTNFGDAIALTRTWQAEAIAPAEAIATTQCPYKGLEYFDCNDTDPQFFYGREALTNQLLDQVRTANFMALVGASGSGKSSVLRAGLLHQLTLGRRIAGSNQWQIVILRPDATPMQNLAEVFVGNGLSQLDRAEALGKAEGLLKEGGAGLARLVQVSEAPRVIVVVDQFEEVFTRCTDLDQRRQFLACLLGALEQVPDKLCLIVAMRADFVGKCLEEDYSGLARRVEQHLVSVLPMTEPELTDAIVEPAKQVGATVEPQLIKTILRDIQTSPGRLPLLQYALKQVWQETPGTLTLAAYDSLGGIDGTLQTRATKLYESFTAAEQDTCRHIFLALTQLGEGTEDTRRRVAQQDLVTNRHSIAQIEAVLAKLTAPDYRLVVTSEAARKGLNPARLAIVDVAHEALIRHWPLLRQWLEADRDRLRQQRRIEIAAADWHEHQQNPGYLLQGLPLAEAIRFQQTHGQEWPLSHSADRFIQVSQRQRRRNRLKTASWLIIPAVAIVGLMDYQLWEWSIRENYARLNGSDYEERQAVQDLVRGCDQVQTQSNIPSYISERMFGACRSLYRTPLAEADLSSTDLSFADLRSANLRSATLRSATLSSTDLHSTNLSFADLRSANLDSADLYSADLYSANLRNANLRNANLNSADLDSTDLNSADLRSADLNSAELYSADLRNANLRNANLTSADLRSADLTSAELYSADLNSAYLNSAYLSSAYLSSAYLSSASLSSADLRRADLRRAYLRSANLSSADLSSANLINANLINANLSSADLSSAYLINVNLSSADLSSAKLNGSILLAADLRTAENLVPEQFTTASPPLLLCNAALPEPIVAAGINPDRDCDQLSQVLQDRYTGLSPEEVQEIIDEGRAVRWQ